MKERESHSPSPQILERLILNVPRITEIIFVTRDPVCITTCSCPSKTGVCTILGPHQTIERMSRPDVEGK